MILYLKRRGQRDQEMTALKLNNNSAANFILFWRFLPIQAGFVRWHCHVCIMLVLCMVPVFFLVIHDDDCPKIGGEAEQDKMFCTHDCFV